MPTWKIKGCYFYFKVGDVEKDKPAHVHIEVLRGEISFWILRNEVKLKSIEGHVNDHEKRKIERIVKENLNFFLEEWEKELNKKK